MPTREKYGTVGCGIRNNGGFIIKADFNIHRRCADGAYIKARKVACWAWGVTPPIGPHSHWSDLFGKMLVRAIKRRTISAKRTQHPTLNTQYSILNTQYSTLNTQHSILNTYHSILNTQYSTLNSQHSILNTQRSTSNTQSSTLNTQHSILFLFRGRRNGVSLLNNLLMIFGVFRALGIEKCPKPAKTEKSQKSS